MSNVIKLFQTGQITQQLSRSTPNKAIPIKKVSFPIPRPTQFFWKSKNNKSRISCKEASTLVTSTRSCLIKTCGLKLSSILRFCSLFQTIDSPVNINLLPPDNISCHCWPANAGVFPAHTGSSEGRKYVGVRKICHCRY